MKKIGGLELANELWLAPLAGVTTPPMREFFTRLGAGLTHTEMVSCMGLVRGNRKTEGMLQILPDEGPVVLQLFSGDTETMIEGGKAALKQSAALSSRSFAALGINMACPMPKVTKRGAGAALLNTPETAFEMTKGLKLLGLPVWVKIRRMPGDARTGERDTLRFVELLASAGADNVCLHGRTPAQRYEGRADRAVVAAAARNFPGLISASGDVYSPEDVTEYMNMGCVGVMLARGALANPSLFPRALDTLGYDIDDDLLNPAAERQIERLRYLGERSRDVCGPRLTVVLLKRLAGGTLKGVPGAAELRRRLGATTDLDELLEILCESAGVAKT